VACEGLVFQGCKDVNLLEPSFREVFGSFVLPGHYPGSRFVWHTTEAAGRCGVNTDPFRECIKESEPTKRDKGYAWHTAIGLQAVDGLKTSEYLAHTAVRNIEGGISFAEAHAFLQACYEENPARDESDRTEEADNFTENAWYFRNSLVRANYNDLRTAFTKRQNSLKRSFAIFY
jgi:hypothetical protein